jgi:hypothetical protein
MVARIGSQTGTALIFLTLAFATPARSEADDPCQVHSEGDRATLSWPCGSGESGRLTLDLRGRLFERIEIVEDATGKASLLAEEVEPATYLVVGSRENPPPTPMGMSVFNVFFDNPAKRPFETYSSEIMSPKFRILSQGERASVAIGPVSFARRGNSMFPTPFLGELVVTVYAGSRLIQVETLIKMTEDRQAFTYDAGLVGDSLDGKKVAWMDTEGIIRRQKLTLQPLVKVTPDTPEAVRHRTIVLEGDAGTIACFPPPHQYFFPRDFTDNLKTVWHGQNHRHIPTGHHNVPASGLGFGIRQPETGGGNYVPWFNAPPGTEQRLGVFYLLTRGKAEEALAEVLKFTHGDRFPELPGYKTFSSHWHMAFTVDAMKKQASGITPLPVPDLVGVFKGLGVEAVHVAEFHGDGHPDDPGPLRLPELAAMFDECKRLSDEKLLLIPGEEANLYLGPRKPGRNPGHWLEMFPKPVFWTMKRAANQPFVEVDPKYGNVYHVGNTEDMFELLKRENGLAWTAHARIKASNFAPDIYKDEDFFKGSFWLGAAWKAMPADLSRPRLGDRCLDLLDDMSNWGRKKYLLGEVDVFKIDHTHEIYGHMNVNYVKLDKLPRFEEGWMPILEALKVGRFFVTTGEVLIEDLKIGGKPAGETLKLDPGDRPEVTFTLSWTFPLKFAEIVSGDGSKVYRERVDLSETSPFGRKSWTLKPDLAGRTWARFEVWDVATDGAFSEPIWIESREPVAARP